jgi:hypothetical protein
MMSLIGFERATGPTSNPAIAIIPRRAIPGLKLRTMESGAEWVEVCPDMYAIQRVKMCPKQTFEQNPVGILEGYRNEAAMLAGLVKHHPAESTQQIAMWIPGIESTSREQTNTQHIFMYSQFEEEEEATHEPSMQDDEEMVPDVRKAQPGPEEDSGPSIPEDLPCMICRSPEDWKNMVLCSTCAKGWHTYCVGIAQIPKGDWDCPQCKKAGKQPLVPPSPVEESSSDPAAPLPDHTTE